MARYRSSYSCRPVRQGSRSERQEYTCFDTFISFSYIPHIRLRKRSWQVDERIFQRHLSPIFGHRRITDLNREEIELWLHDLTVQGLAPATCNRILAVFKSVCSLAVSHGLLSMSNNPCLGVYPMKTMSYRERYLSAPEARKLVRELERSTRLEAMALRLLLLTGARKSEILQARWENVRLDQHLLTVPLSKSGRPRYIFLSKEATDVVQALPKQPGNPWLFPSKHPGKHLSDLYWFWDRIRQKLGLADVRVHDLRHTFASFLVNSGHSLYEVQKLLGHSDPRTTARYAHLSENSLLAAAQAVSHCLFRATTQDKVRRPVLKRHPPKESCRRR